MTGARNALAAIVALLAVSTVLVMLASSAGSDRPSVQFSGTAPRSTLQADYAVDTGVAMKAPLSVAILDAARRDRLALGLPELESAAPPPSLNASTASDLAANTGAGEASQTDLQTPAGLEGASPSAIQATAAGSSIPWVPIAAAVLAVALVAWGAAYVLRPSRD